MKKISDTLANEVDLIQDTLFWGLKNGNLQINQDIESFILSLEEKYKQNPSNGTLSFSLLDKISHLKSKVEELEFERDELKSTVSDLEENEVAENSIDLICGKIHYTVEGSLALQIEVEDFFEKLRQKHVLPA